jgi:hypothetical protein
MMGRILRLRDGTLHMKDETDAEVCVGQLLVEIYQSLLLA